MIKKMLPSFGLALVTLAAVPAGAFAADMGGAVSGVVVDAGRQAVAGMSVRATDVVDPSKTYSSVTDSEGRFSIAQLPAGSYLVSAETVNTSWIQKDDSPIVEISGASSPSVTLVLVKTSELSPATVGGDEHDLDGLHIGLLGLTTLATAGVIVALVNLNDLEEDHDQQNLRDADLERLLTVLRGEQNDLRRQLQDLARDNKEGREELERKILELQGDIESLCRFVGRNASPRKPSPC